jgi:prepilin-type N-terminal cleavage/methylation domain-containing protein
MKIKNNNQRGYTIIETMIAVSIFLVVVMIGMGALLNANSIHQKSQNMRSIMDNLSFIMEDMSRNLRTGTNYVSNTPDEISFETSNGEQWIYKIEPVNEYTAISRSINGDAFIPLNPLGEVIIGEASSEFLTSELYSGFSVAGTDPDDGQQPFVTIKLVGVIRYKDVDTPFSLRTLVSQRLIDR